MAVAISVTVTVSHAGFVGGGDNGQSAEFGGFAVIAGWEGSSCGAFSDLDADAGECGHVTEHVGVGGVG